MTSYCAGRSLPHLPLTLHVQLPSHSLQQNSTPRQQSPFQQHPPWAEIPAARSASAAMQIIVVRGTHGIIFFGVAGRKKNSVRFLVSGI
jgi:hypothetical protein